MGHPKAGGDVRDNKRPRLRWSRLCVKRGPLSGQSVIPTFGGIVQPRRMPTMVKEQKRGNKEVRKQKGDRKKPAVTASVSSLMAGSLPLGRLPKAKS